MVSGCHGKTPTGPAFAPGGTRVLFIGNSLTYSNNLPGMYIALARLAGNTTVEAASVAFPDFALEDHWAEGTARRALGPNTWEFVVMQQGSSALPASQVNLRTWATQFAPAIRSAGAEPVMFMVWPTTSRVGDFPAVLQSYRDAASAIGGLFAPAGDAWTAFGDLPALYSVDGLHPGVRGTYLAALVLLQRTLGIRPGQLPATIPGTSVGEAEVRALQQAAQVALDRNPARPVGATPPSSLRAQPARAIVDSAAQARSSFRAAAHATTPRDALTHRLIVADGKLIVCGDIASLLQRCRRGKRTHEFGNSLTGQRFIVDDQHTLDHRVTRGTRERHSANRVPTMSRR